MRLDVLSLHHALQDESDRHSYLTAVSYPSENTESAVPPGDNNFQQPDSSKE